VTRRDSGDGDADRRTGETANDHYVEQLVASAVFFVDSPLTETFRLFRQGCHAETTGKTPTTVTSCLETVHLVRTAPDAPDVRVFAIR